ILNDISHFFNQENVTEIITGCNTTVSIFKNELPSIFHRPVQSLFDNTRQYYKENNYTILSTENSSKNQLFTHFLSNKNVITEEIACENLAYLIETNQIVNAKELLIKKARQASHKNIILGCTHYPLILDEVLPELPEVNWINPAKFLSRNTTTNNVNKPQITFYTSGSESRFQQQINQYLKLSQYKLNGKRHNVPSLVSNPSLV
ncbi:MAG: aspartate/glutamate racemase family protein, partial [Candidatus Margulisiibacteriota bacterium]